LQISPEHIRGAILANWQLADAAGTCLVHRFSSGKLTVSGIFFGFLCNLLIVIYVDPSLAWRILTSTTLIPTVPLLVMIYFMPESPRYLMKHGRYEKALDSFNQIQTTPLLAARDFMYAHAQLEFESRMLKGTAHEFRSLADRIDVRNGSLAYEAQELSRTRRDIPQESSGIGSVNHERFEMAVLQRRLSNSSSLDINMGIQEARTRADKAGNPYSYHIGVTGYFKRLMQLWSNMRCRRALLAASTAMISQQVRNSVVNGD
jgi:hypothetical protein